MHVGICGYTGSGKSTVFEALAPGAKSKKGVAYGNIKVPDARIDRLGVIFEPRRKVYAEVTFLDYGSQDFSSTGAFPSDVVQAMRNADLLVHVVRVFNNPMLTEPADPTRDVGRFNDELLLLDLSILERRGERFRKENRKDAAAAVNARCVEHLEAGEHLRTLELSDEELETLTGIQLLSMKPLITLYNFSEDSWEEEKYAALREVRETGKNELSLAICAEIEKEIAELDAEEQAEFLESLGLEAPARDLFVQSAYALLDYISFLTAGKDECRAWPIRRDTIAQKAAGKVHSDIERGFIRAEIYRLEDLEELGSEAALKAAGKMRVEGKTYVMQDGDVVNYRFNV